MTQPQDDIPVAEPVITPIININDIFDELNRLKKLNNDCLPHLIEGVAHAEGAIEGVQATIAHIKETQAGDYIDDFEEIKEGYEEDRINTLQRKNQMDGENMVIEHMIKFLQNKYNNQVIINE